MYRVLPSASVIVLYFVESCFVAAALAHVVSRLHPATCRKEHAQKDYTAACVLYYTLYITTVLCPSRPNSRTKACESACSVLHSCGESFLTIQ